MTDVRRSKIQEFPNSSNLAPNTRKIHEHELKRFLNWRLTVITFRPLPLVINRAKEQGSDYRDNDRDSNYKSLFTESNFLIIRF